MKVDDHFILLKGQAASSPGPRRPRASTGQNAQPGVVLLISQENQRAWRAKPNSLEEAKRILDKVQTKLDEGSAENLAEVHRLDFQCLVRLR
jgi:hypothetical protein